MIILTASWLAPLPPGHVRIGICRNVPKGFESAVNFRKLAPFAMKGLPPREFEKAYDEHLNGFDADLILGKDRAAGAGQGAGFSLLGKRTSHPPRADLVSPALGRALA